MVPPDSNYPEIVNCLPLNWMYQSYGILDGIALTQINLRDLACRPDFPHPNPDAVRSSPHPTCCFFPVMPCSSSQVASHCRMPVNEVNRINQPVDLVGRGGKEGAREQISHSTAFFDKISMD